MRTIHTVSSRAPKGRGDLLKDCFVTAFLAMTLIFSLLFPINKVFATPPVSITLTYDVSASSLHVEAIHPSFDVVRSYVRLMVLSVNGKEIKTLNYYQQNSPEKFWDDVPLEAKVGDTIKVDLYCTLGGTKSEEITVKKEGE